MDHPTFVYESLASVASASITPTITILKIYSNSTYRLWGQADHLLALWPWTVNLNKLFDFSFHLYKISLLVFTSRLGGLDKIIHEKQLDLSHSKSLMIANCYYFNYSLIGLFEHLVGKHLINSLVDIWFFHEQKRGERVFRRREKAHKDTICGCLVLPTNNGFCIRGN